MLKLKLVNPKILNYIKNQIEDKEGGNKYEQK